MGEKQKAKTNLLHTHFLIVFDLIFRDDAVGLLRLLPGELDAALLHLLLDDLADLGWSCLDKNMSVSEGQSLSAHTHTHTHTHTRMHTAGHKRSETLTSA